MEHSKAISLKEFVLSSVKTLSSAILNKDTSHAIFHGCYDWHSAVHGHWALLREYFEFYSSLTDDEKSEIEKAADLVAQRLFDDKNEANLNQEHTTLKTNLHFEFPYGRSWLLRLAIEFKMYCRTINSEQYKTLTKMADDVAKLMLKQYTDSGIGDILAPEYANASWALAQMFDFFNDTYQPDLAEQVSNMVKKNYLSDAVHSRASFSLDYRLPYFFSGFGNMVYVVLKTQKEDEIRLFFNKYEKEFNSELWAPIKLRQNSQIHHFGTNWSRIWAINAIKNTINSYKLTEYSHLNTMLDQARDKHAEEGFKMHHYFSVTSTHAGHSSYLVYDHWVPQFGTLYGVATPGGRKLDVYTIDPQVGKATANVTSFYLMNMDATCNKLLLSYDNRTQELGLSCDDNLYFVDIWWNWRVSSVMNSDLWGKGTVVNIVPSWDDYYEGNCALTLYPPTPTSGLKDAPMGSVTCFALSAESQLSIAYGPYYWIKKTQPFVFSTPSKQIGIFNYISNRDFILWGKSLADNSSNLVALDQRSVTLEAWDSFMKFNVDINQLSGSTSYSHPLMGNITVIELTTGVIVLDLTTKTMSNVVSFCQGHAKIGSSAFDPVNKIMYSLVSCYSGPMLVTFDIKNDVVKNAVKFDESALYIKGLFYTL